MTEQEDFVVQAPYQPSNEENKAILELKSNGSIARPWDSKKKYIKSFKKNLREDLYKKQNKLCAYCRIRVPLACVALPLEHIVYKDDHPQWMFLPENLCVSCPTCNGYKGTTEVLDDPQTTNYPKVSTGFKIIHPMYDKYSEHIELVGDVLYRGKTNKGVFTIETCHLYRVDLAEERVDMKRYAENKGTIIAELINLLRMPDTYVDDKEKFKKIVTDAVNEYKKKQGMVNG